MRLRDIFRRTIPTYTLLPAEQAQIAADYRARVHEAKVMSAWELEPADWAEMSDTARAYFRTNYTKAPRYTP